MSNKYNPTKVPLIFFVILFFLLTLRSFIFEKISTKALYDFDEARYAEIAKNTLSTNNWLIPLAGGPDDPSNITISGLHPYLWKPPLHTWIISLSYLIIGQQSELAVRLPSLLFSLLSLIIIFKICQSFFPEHRFIPYLAIILFSISNDFSFISSQGIAEAQLLFFNLLCLFLLLKPSTNKILLSGVSLGLAIMTKSFAVFWVVPLAVFLIYKYQPSKLIIWLLSIAIIAVPWHLFMYLKFGNLFINNYLLVNTVGRGLGEQNNVAPIYWYLKYALWQWPYYLVFIPVSLIFPKKYFLIIWIFLIFIPFSLIKSKVWWYIFPVWVPFCSYAAYLLDINYIKFPKITALFFILFTLITGYNTYLQANSRTDWNLGIKLLGRTHPNLTKLSVYKIPYESPLFYFNSKTIERGIKQTSDYVITNRDYYQELDPKVWQVIDNKYGDYLLHRIN